MPDNVGIGRGFIISDQGTSKQIDVLLYDKTYPIIFKDSDLVFITLNAVKGFVEVKSKCTNSVIDTAFDSLTKNIDFLLDNGINMSNVFVGLFSYEMNEHLDYHCILKKLQSKASNNINKVINHLCIGDELFIKFWNEPPEIANNSSPEWHAYALERANVAYFINNLINICSDGKIDDNSKVWFQYDENDRTQIKENKLRGIISLVNG